jgi:tetratricopeptide (TPR) repeat protein
MRKSLAIGLATLEFLVAGCRQDNVARVYDGREVSGRWVSPDAYAAFADGALLDAQGNRAAAAAAYERAVAEDSRNAVAWGRLGAVRCLTSRDTADRAFARAESLEPDIESPWISRAACALERNDARAAVTFALRAAALSPYGHDANALVVTALERSGDPRAAERWRRGLGLGLPGAAGVPASAASPRDEYERALAGADAAEVERAAIRARIPSSELSLHSVAHGRIDVASRVATAVLEADPASSDARIAALASADLGRDEPALKRWMTSVPRGATAPSPLGAELMEALIGRRVGPEAARSFRAAYGGAPGR